MRVAVCIAGQPRTYKICGPLTRQCFEHRPDVKIDYFIHTWNKDFGNFTKWYQYDDLELQKSLESVYNPRISIVEDWEKVGVVGVEAQFYSISTVLKKFLEYRSEYDWVFFARHDWYRAYADAGSKTICPFYVDFSQIPLDQTSTFFCPTERNSIRRDWNEFNEYPEAVATFVDDWSWNCSPDVVSKIQYLFEDFIEFRDKTRLGNFLFEDRRNFAPEFLLGLYLTANSVTVDRDKTGAVDGQVLRKDLVEQFNGLQSYADLENFTEYVRRNGWAVEEK